MRVVFPSTAKHGLQHRSSRHLHNLCSLTTQLNFGVILNYPFSNSQPREERVEVFAAAAHLLVKCSEIKRGCIRTASSSCGAFCAGSASGVRSRRRAGVRMLMRSLRGGGVASVPLPSKRSCSPLWQRDGCVYYKSVFVHIQPAELTVGYREVPEQLLRAHSGRGRVTTG